MYTCACMCMWRPEVKFGSPPYLFKIYYYYYKFYYFDCVCSHEFMSVEARREQRSVAPGAGVDAGD